MTQAPASTVVAAEMPQAPAKSGLVDWIARRPGSAFAAFLALHFAVWTALPTLLYANLPLDLLWWMVEIAYRVFGSDAAYYALGEASAVVAFALIWATARPLVGHYSPDHPQVLIDGLPRRAPWIDLNDLRAKGAVLVWNVGDFQHLPPEFAAVAPAAQVGTPLTLPARRFGIGEEHNGWAVLMPQSPR